MAKKNETSGSKQRGQFDEDESGEQSTSGQRKGDAEGSEGQSGGLSGAGSSRKQARTGDRDLSDDE